MKIKLSNTPDPQEGGTVTSLPEGWYTFKLDKAVFGESPGKGTPQISIWAKVINDAKFTGKTRIANFYLTEKALWKLKAFLLSFNYANARKDIEPEDLISDLEKIKPTFRAYVIPNGKNNDFTQFDTALSESDSDLPFSDDNELDDLPI